MHKWISTDGGSQCYRCGLVVDDADAISDAARQEIHSLVPWCNGPETVRAHHFVPGWELYGYRDPLTGRQAGYTILECAYGDAVSTPFAWPHSPECAGDGGYERLSGDESRWLFD